MQHSNEKEWKRIGIEITEINQREHLLFFPLDALSLLLLEKVFTGFHFLINLARGLGRRKDGALFLDNDRCFGLDRFLQGVQCNDHTR